MPKKQKNSENRKIVRVRARGIGERVREDYPVTSSWHPSVGHWGSHPFSSKESTTAFTDTVSFKLLFQPNVFLTVYNI